MSIWTHVNGSIRVDSIRAIGMPCVEPGNRTLFGGPKENRYSFDMPCGSEGSLEYHLWVNPEVSSLSTYTLNIFGDLRDFGEEDEEDILDYLKLVTAQHMVRSGIVEVNIEGGPIIIYRHKTTDDGESRWIKTLIKDEE